MNNKRRKLLLFMAGLAASPALTVAQQKISTPRQTAGPFYPVDLPLDDDSDLTRVAGSDGIAKGQISDLTGRILDLNGRPLSDLRIEIWQCDANGRYRHPRENGNKPIDANFQGHGHAITDAQGNYRFRTIRPVAYPGRTPHIHIAVFPEGERPFVTQLYVKGDPGNQSDFLFNRIPVERREMVLAEFARDGNSDNHLRASFDIVLDKYLGTPMDKKA